MNGRTLRLAGIATALLAAAAATTAATAGEPRWRHGGDVSLAFRLEQSTARLHDVADDHLRDRGFRGRELADRLHKMDEWARYYRVSVQRTSFHSAKSRQRYERFLQEYAASCDLMDRMRPGWLGREQAELRRTVVQLNAAYGVRVAYDRDHDRWEDRDDDRYARDRDRDDDRWDGRSRRR